MGDFSSSALIIQLGSTRIIEAHPRFCDREQATTNTITYSCFDHARVFGSGACIPFHASSKLLQAIEIIFGAFSARGLILWHKIAGLASRVLAWKLACSLQLCIFAGN